MKTLVSILILAFSFQIHAQSRQLSIQGEDAGKLMDIFRDVARTSSISNPVTGTVSNMFMHFELANKAFVLNCVEKNPGLSANHSCRLLFDPVRGGVSVTTQAGGEKIEVHFTDPATALKIQNNLQRDARVNEFSANEKIGPRLQVTCSSLKNCRLIVTN